MIKAVLLFFQMTGCLVSGSNKWAYIFNIHINLQVRENISWASKCKCILVNVRVSYCYWCWCEKYVTANPPKINGWCFWNWHPYNFSAIIHCLWHTTGPSCARFFFSLFFHVKMQALFKWDENAKRKKIIDRSLGPVWQYPPFLYDMM